MIQYFAGYILKICFVQKPLISYIFAVDVSSHYYAVLAMCRMLGIKSVESRRIAYSSQFVDDALIERVSFKRVPRGVKCHVHGKKRFLDQAATCPHITTVWTYRNRTMVEQLVPFHFVPACRGERFYQRMRTFPDSPILDALVQHALASGDSYQLGIVLHVLADAYSHKGFSGIIGRCNRIKKLRYKREGVRDIRDRTLARYLRYVDGLFLRLFGRIMPVYSHSHVGTLPDIASAEWSYKYDTGTSFFARFEDSGLIRNPERYIQAFDHIRLILNRFIKAHPEICEDLPAFRDEELFRKQLIKPYSRAESIRTWKLFLLDHNLLDRDDPGLNYDPHQWIRDAFADYGKRKYAQRRVLNAKPVPEFARSDWYAFYSAAREYKEQYDLLVIRYDLY